MGPTCCGSASKPNLIWKSPGRCMPCILHQKVCSHAIVVLEVHRTPDRHNSASQLCTFGSEAHIEESDCRCEHVLVPRSMFWEERRCIGTKSLSSRRRRRIKQSTIDCSSCQLNPGMGGNMSCNGSLPLACLWINSRSLIARWSVL